LIYFNLHCGLSTSAAVSEDFVYRDFANADYVGLNNYLASIDWQFVMVNSYDINLYWNSFVHAMNAAIALFVPLKHSKFVPTSRRRHYPHFIRQLFRKRLAAWQAYRRFDTTKENYLRFDRKCKLAVSSFETEAEQRLIDSGNIGHFYRYVNNKIVSKADIGVIKSESN